MKKKKIDLSKFYGEKEIYYNNKQVDRVTDSELCFLLSIKFCFYFFTGNYSAMYFESLETFNEYQETLFSYRKKLKVKV